MTNTDKNSSGIDSDESHDNTTNHSADWVPVSRLHTHDLAKGRSNPKALRVFSILPDEDADEAYCKRHNEEMVTAVDVVRTDGAVYTTAEGFNAYTCPQCLQEAATIADTSADRVNQLHLTKAFETWDEGEAPDNWFQYVGEVDEVGLCFGERFEGETT